ncbi:MAG: tRNA(His) guanylyltransferase Thg1 family protein [Pyrobaculum sp.]
MDISPLLSLDPKTLEKRYREREAFCEPSRPPAAVRLDGVGFGKRLKDFPPPRSALVHAAMVETARLLAATYGADYAYTVSDEINLIFLDAVPHGGRTFKIITVLASHAAAHLSTKLTRPLHFDGRVIKLENKCDVAKYILYRARIGLNNYVIQIARANGLLNSHTPPITQLIKQVKIDYELAIGTLLTKPQKYAPTTPLQAEELCQH